MSLEIRNRIAYWFFLIIGMVGVIFFTYEFSQTEDYSFIEWLSICSTFTVFIFRPMILLDVFELIKNKLSK